MAKPDWASLRAAVQDQLNAIGSTPGEVAARAGLSRETVRPIINGVPGNYRPATLAKVSLALGWTGDSIEKIIAGGTPEVVHRHSDRLDLVEQRLDRIEAVLQQLLDAPAAP